MLAFNMVGLQPDQVLFAQMTIRERLMPVLEGLIAGSSATWGAISSARKPPSLVAIAEDSFLQWREAPPLVLHYAKEARKRNS